MRLDASRITPVFAAVAETAAQRIWRIARDALIAPCQ